MISKNYSFAWKEFLDKPGAIKLFLGSFVFTAGICICCAKFFAFNANNTGMIINDSIQHILKPYDFSTFIFFLVYLSVILVLIDVSNKPYYLLKCFWAYAALTVIRVITVKLIPLNPPHDMIYLVDPFTSFFFGKDIEVNNDLFFSGHIATIFFFFLVAKNQYFKWFFIMASMLLAVLLVWQHVHYSTDVVFAPLFSLGVYELIVKDKLMNRFWQTEESYGEFG